MKKTKRERWIAPVFITIVIIICLLTCSKKGFGQEDDPCGKNSFGIGNIISIKMDIPNNVFYGAFFVQDNGKGLGYIRRIYTKLGGYTSLSKGKYWINGTDYFVKHHKSALGIVYYMPSYDIMEGYFTLGGSYHYFGSEGIPSWVYDTIETNTAQNRLKHWSFELGCGMRVGRFITSGFGFDFLRDESYIYLGISF